MSDYKKEVAGEGGCLIQQLSPSLSWLAGLVYLEKVHPDAPQIFWEKIKILSPLTPSDLSLAFFTKAWAELTTGFGVIDLPLIPS